MFREITLPIFRNTRLCVTVCGIINPRFCPNIQDARCLKVNHCCREKEIIITYSECVSVTLATQHAKRMRRIILSRVVSLALPYFFHIIS